jgi:hypothetical protein
MNRFIVNTILNTRTNDTDFRNTHRLSYKQIFVLLEQKDILHIIQQFPF